MDKIEKSIIDECYRLEYTYHDAEPGSDKEYCYSKAYDAMLWIYENIGLKVTEENAIPILKIVKDSLDRVMERIKFNSI